MAPITTISFSRNKREYVIDLNLDDAMLMEGSFVIEVKASVREDSIDVFEETLTLELDFERRRGEIRHRGELWHEFSLNDLPFPRHLQDSESPEGMELGNEDAPDPMAEFVHKSVGKQIEDLLVMMPVPDPILGCALKAGLTSILGQSLVCNALSGGEGSRRQKFWRIAHCLRDHVGGIFTTTLWRAARCMATLGVG